MTGAELERAVAAALQASGWFLLRGATDPTHQAFELDVLGYRFDGGDEASLAVESKGGKSGFGDLWKLLGLKTHLGIDLGVLLADASEPLHEHKAKYARSNGIELIDRDAAALPAGLLAAGATGCEPEPPILAAWQRCFRVEDGLTKILNDRTLWKQWSTIRIAKEQLQHLVTKAWMEADPWKQALELYELYQAEPKIAKRMATEMSPGQAERAFREAMYHGALSEVQACFYLEHRKRIAVAFAATRCAALDDDSSHRARNAPSSFRSMVRTIRDEEAWYLPVALQVFFLGFGAMICTDAPEAEFEAIASQARCTPAEAERALELFEELFPTDGWFYKDYDLVRLKLVPVPLRGAGTWMREAVYENDWDVIATANQLAVAGEREREKASETERLVLPRPPRRSSRRLRQT